jgi:hypothetical protein
MTHSREAHGAGQSTPTSDEADGANVGLVGEQSGNESPDSHGAPYSGQALRVIEGEGKAVHYLARLHAQQADPDEPALIVSMLYGATLRGFCRVIEKALGVHHA